LLGAVSVPGETVYPMLGVLAESFVVAPPKGVTIRTRLRPTPAQEQALREVGTFLGALYRADLAGRLGQGRLDAAGTAASARVRKKDLTSESSSRWAGSITRATRGQYDLAVRTLAEQRVMLLAATGKLAARVAAPVGGRAGKVAGYRSPGERHAKTRRLAQLTSPLGPVETALASGRPGVVLGGWRLWRARNNLAQANLSVQAWECLWTHRRMFLSAGGESGKRFGNETIRVEAGGQLSIKVPGALADKLGSHLRLEVPVVFGHKAQVWADRVAANRCVATGSRSTPTGDAGTCTRRGLLAKPEHVPTPVQLAASGPVLGVDLNQGHLAGWVVDPSGNPVGAPVTVPLLVADLPGPTRDARVREAITALIHTAQARGCVALATGDLSLPDARATGAETMGRGRRGKKFRATVAGLATAQLRDRLAAMAWAAGLWVIAVDPAYTSRWGAQHWLKPLQQNQQQNHQASVPTVSGHHGAAVAIGRRAHTLTVRRKRNRPRHGHRTMPGQPPVSTAGTRAGRRPGTRPAPPTARSRLPGPAGTTPRQPRTPFVGQTGQDILLLSV
jgi:hypothetical protein